jgi:hypothetical protein
VQTVDATAAGLSVTARLVSVVYSALTPSLKAAFADDFADVRDTLRHAATALDNDELNVVYSDLRGLGVRLGVLGQHLADAGCAQRPLDLIWTTINVLNNLRGEL